MKEQDLVILLKKLTSKGRELSLRKLAEELGIRVLAPTVGKELHDDNAPGTQRHDGKDAEDHDGRDIGLQHHLHKRDGIVQKNLLRKNSGRKHTPRAQCSKNI